MNKADDINDASRKFLGLVRELYGRVAWTHKTHEKDREIWSGKVCLMRWVNVVLIGITSILATVGAISNSQMVFVATSIFGAMSTAFVVYQLSFNPEKSEAEHRMVAKRLLYLRDQYLILIQEAMSGRTPIEELQNRLESLHREASIVYEYAPDSSSKAYTAASEALKTKEELTFSREEIDMLLPEDLRLTTKMLPEIEGETKS
ncbi:MAG: SLATT domain-containing protein [Planctomycetota bacterium]